MVAHVKERSDCVSLILHAKCDASFSLALRIIQELRFIFKVFNSLNIALFYFFTLYINQYLCPYAHRDRAVPGIRLRELRGGAALRHRA